MADSRASASTGSNNPFRRKAAPAPGATSSSGALTRADPVFDSPSAAVDPPPLQPTTSDYFRQQLQALPQTNAPPPSTTFQKPKVVKKVRVQSPPPSSPESASGAPDDYPISGYGNEDSESSSSSDSEEAEDPFRATAPPLGVIGLDNYSMPTNARPASGRPPANPFKKTLEDMEHGLNDVPPISSPSVGGKGSLDVDSFKRLLMTGQANTPGAVPSPSTASPQTSNPPTQAADAASITDASSVSRQSIFDTNLVQETPRTSHEISEAEGEDDRLGLIKNPQAKTQQTPSTLRKKPPPPSSRHGKLIKVDLAQKENNGPGLDGILRPSSSSSQRAFPTFPGASSTSSRQRPSTPSDVNKPLPAAPARRSTDDGSESIFDREAAGKVPEPVATDPDTHALPELPTPRPPTPPNVSHTTKDTPTLSDTKKPPPPPRRNPLSHSRSESKPPAAPKASPGMQVALTTTTEEAYSIQRRSSQDSTRSRSSSLRVSIHAPAPPPPRRPNHASRPSFTSPSAASFTSITPTSATSPAPSDAEQPPFYIPAPLITSPETPAVSPGPSPLNAASVSAAATAPSSGAAKPKLAPPPVPPARNASVRSSAGRSRRPSSVSSFDATSRRMNVKDASASVMAPPPPAPPRRSRAGSGREGAAPTTGTAMLGGSVTEEPVPTASMDGSSSRRSEDKSADDILADLSALQREVDALRGRYEKRVSGSASEG